MSKHIFMAYDSGGIKMSDYMLEATKDSFVFDFSRNSIYTHGNEFGYTGVVAYEIPSDQLTPENRKIITNVYKTLTGEIGVTYTSLGSSSSGESIVGGVEVDSIALTGPTTYAKVISNITQDALGQIGYTYNYVYTGHATQAGIENNFGAYSINGVSLSPDGVLTYSYRDLTVTDGIASSDIILGGTGNSANVNVITGIRETADGKISYTYSSLSTTHTYLGIEEVNERRSNIVITNAHLDASGNFTYSYYTIDVTNNTPRYNENNIQQDESQNPDSTVVNISSANPKDKATRVVTNVDLFRSGLSIGLEYSYSYIYANNAHHETLNGTQGPDIAITGEGAYIISGAYLSPEGVLSYTYSNYTVHNSVEAETLTYLTVETINHSDNLYSLVDIVKDNQTGRIIAFKTSLETTQGAIPTPVALNSVAYYNVVDNINQSKDGKITYTMKQITNSHTYTGVESAGNHVINNINITPQGNLTYTYCDVSVTSGEFTNSVQDYSSHATEISGVTNPQTYLPNNASSAISLVNGIRESADGKISYSYISLYGDPDLFLKHIFNLSYDRNYSASQLNSATIPVVYLLEKTPSQNNSISDVTALNYSTAEVPTKYYIDNLMQANDALRYCGTVDASQTADGNITLHYHPDSNTSGFDENNPDLLKGAVYKVTNIGYIGNQRVSPGDMIISYTDSPAPTVVTSISGWDVINENIDIRQTNAENVNADASNKVITNVHISADGELSYTYNPIDIRTIDVTDVTLGEGLRQVGNTIATYNISSNSTNKVGVPVITYVGTSYEGLTHTLQFKVSYIYSSQNHHSQTGVNNTSNSPTVITNISLTNDGQLSYVYNTETAYTYSGVVLYENTPSTYSLDAINILHSDGTAETNVGYNVITGVKLERHENEVSLSYTYTSIYASQNHHSTEKNEVIPDVVLTALGTQMVSGVSLSANGTLTYCAANLIVEDAGTLSVLAAKQVDSYTYSIVNIYKDMDNHGIVTYSYVDLSMDTGEQLEDVTVKEEVPVNVITGISQRGDGKISYAYQTVNIASLWERGAGAYSVKTVSSGCETTSAYSVVGGYCLLGTSEEKGESVFGQYNNADNRHVIHTIGIGYYSQELGAPMRMNAIEILNNGDFYIYGLGKYDGTNSTYSYTKSLQQYIEDKEFVISYALNDLHNTDIDLQNQINSIPIVWDKGSGEHSAILVNSGSVAHGNYSVAEGTFNVAYADDSHAEGHLSYAYGASSHVEGNHTIAYNLGEHAEGSYNYSNKESANFGNYLNTMHSIGIGTSDTDRKNAFEVMQNGDIYVYGLGDYNGTNEYAATTLQQYINTVGVWEKGSGAYSVQTKGTRCKASGAYSVASGKFSYTPRNFSFATGFHSYALGAYSVAEGCYTYAIGTYTHAEGHYSYVYGINSHGEGAYTYVLGDYSHAEGAYTQALGTYTHAEGYQTYVYGSFSHAEGYQTYALNVVAHAEGNNSYALGMWTHAEGHQTYAFGKTSHAEGEYTYTIGINSHSEGLNTYAYGDASHAEGNNSYSLGITSHAEGLYTYAIGNYSHSEGNHTYTYNSGEHAQGQYNISYHNTDTWGNAYNTHHTIGIGTADNIRKNAVTVMQNGDYYLINVGDYDGTNPENAYTLQEYIAKIGVWERGEGEMSVKTKGTNCVSYGPVSVAEGNFTLTNSDALYSHAEGQYTYTGAQAAHAEGKLTYALGRSSHAEGYGSYTGLVVDDHLPSSDEGVNEVGSFAHAEGRLTVAYGPIGSHAEGNRTIASGSCSHAEGSLTISEGDASHAEGNRTHASYNCSHAEGTFTYSAGQATHAEGFYSYAIAGISHAEGNYTYSYGIYSHTEGAYTFTDGTASHAEGWQSYSFGSYSHAEGEHLIAFGRGSHAEGESLYTYSQIANDIGEITPANILNFWNSGPGDNAFSFAYGEASHVEGLDNITIGRFSHVEGWMSLAYGQGSHAEGVGTSTYGEYSHTEGSSSVAYGESSHAEGRLTITNSSALYSHAEGFYTYTGSFSAHAEGSYTYALGSYSHAEGKGTYTMNKYTHAEGLETYAVGWGSHAEGVSSEIFGSNSINGINVNNKNKAIGIASHTEGENSVAIGRTAHAEGQGTYAYADYSHAEGHYTYSHGQYSHAEGYCSNSYGQASHAEGSNTYTYNESENAIGQYNVSHTGEGGNNTWKASSAYTVHSVGIGTAENSRKNAIEIMQNGDFYLYGIGNYDGNNIDNAVSLQSYLITAGVWEKGEGDISVQTKESSSFAKGSYSVASGRNTYAYNIAENTIGQYNVSHTGNGSAVTWYGDSAYTVHSVGIGTADNARKNAIEIMQNGDFYLYGIGDYDGTNPDDATTLQTYLTTAGVWERGDGTLAVQTKETSSYAVGDYTVASGYFTYAYNQAESAFGQYNVSNYYEGEDFGYCYNTIHSIGVGYIFHDTENDEDIEVRKNALEITQNGELYLLGIGEYDGTNTEVAQSLREVIIEDELIISYAFNDLDQRIDILQYTFDNIPAAVFERGQGTNSIQAADAECASTGEYSFSVGYNSISTGNYSNTFGSICNTSGNYSTTFGFGNYNSGNYSIVNGVSNSTYNTNNTIFGRYNYSSSVDTAIIGSNNQSYSSTFIFGNNNNLSSSNYSVVLGHNTEFTNSSSAASIGRYNSFDNSGNSFALGYNNSLSSSNYSSVIGVNSSLSSSLYSVSIGSGNSTTGNYSVNIGSNNTITSANALGIGNNLSVTASGEIAVGKYNYSNGSVLEVGIGTSSDRKNALEVDANGELYLFGIGDYSGNNLSSAKSLQQYLEENERTISEALNDLNDRILDLTDISNQLVSSPFEYGTGTLSIQSIGTSCSANGNYSFAEGYSTLARNDYEVALGVFNVSTKTNSTFGNAGNTALSVGIGTEDNTRKNAFEIMQNGDIYVYGLGNYNGANLSGETTLSLQEVISSLSSATSGFSLSVAQDSDGNDVITLTIGGVSRSITLTNSWGEVTPVE